MMKTMKTLAQVEGKEVQIQVGSKKQTGIIVDVVVHCDKYWVETSEDCYCVDMDKVVFIETPVKSEELKIASVQSAPKKSTVGSASVSFCKWEDTNFFGGANERLLTVNFTLTAKSEEDVWELWKAFESKFEEQFCGEVDWTSCPATDNSDGKWYYTESFDIPFSHGMMATIKKEIKDSFKAVKKEMGLK